MDLKFSFSGPSPDRHDHGDAPSGTPLTISRTPGSGALEARVTRDTTAIKAEIITGDGVTYTTAEVETTSQDPESLARPVRSAMSRAVAALDGPLAEQITSVTLVLGGVERDVLNVLGVTTEPLAVDDALQGRVGILAGTKILIEE